MNERLKQYAKQSRLEVYSLGKDYDKWNDVLEKFAELIVDDICDNMMSLEPMYPANIVALKIRQRYGVK